EVAVRTAETVEVEIPVVARIDTPDDGVPEVVIGIVDLRAGTGARDLAEQPGIRLQAAHELPDRLTESLRAVASPRTPVHIEPPAVDIEFAHPVCHHIQKMRLEVVVLPVQIRQVPEAVVLEVEILAAFRLPDLRKIGASAVQAAIVRAGLGLQVLEVGRFFAELPDRLNPRMHG